MFWLPQQLPSGFDGVEPLQEAKVEDGSYRALARELGRSPSHICRVMRGERQSMRLAKLLKKRGIKVKEGK